MEKIPWRRAPVDLAMIQLRPALGLPKSPTRASDRMPLHADMDIACTTGRLLPEITTPDSIGSLIRQAMVQGSSQRAHA